MTRDDILTRFAFYREAGPGTRRTVRGGGRVVNLAPGTYFAHEGCPLEGVALVGAGRLRVFKSSTSGREITLYEVRAGEFCLLNILTMLTGRPSPASARVEEPVEAVLVPNDGFAAWLESAPGLRDHVLGAVATGVIGIMNLIEEIAFKKLDLRLAEYLCQNLRTGPDGACAFERTHEAIAADLGSSREVISRLLKEFERQGAVVLGRGRLAVADGEALMALADRGQRMAGRA